MMQAALDIMPPESPFPREMWMRFGVILDDPNWRFNNYSEAGEGRNANQHYDCVNADVIARIPVWHLAGKDCWRITWTTAPMVEQALAVIKAQRFKFCTMGTWGKETKDGSKLRFGTGYIRRSGAEFYIVSKVGEPRIKPAAAFISNLLFAPTREHSRKPDEMYRQIEDSFDGPYVELNARQRWPGWEQILSDEADKYRVAT